MFGLIGAAIFGIVATGAWIKDEQYEQSRRKNARINGNNIYIDKNGRLRNTITGRKLTKEEIHQAFFNDEEAKKRREYYENKYWGVKDLLHYDMTQYVIELFVTEKEAEEFANKIRTEMSRNENLKTRITYVNVATYSQAYIDGLNNNICWNHEFHNNF